MQRYNRRGYTGLAKCIYNDVMLGGDAHHGNAGLANHACANRSRYSAAAATGQSVTELLRAAVELYLEHEDIPAYTPVPTDGQMDIDDIPK